MLFRHIGNVDCVDPIGCQKVPRGFVLAAELGSTKIQGNEVRSGIAGLMEKKTQRERERDTEWERERRREPKRVLLLLTTLSKTSVSHGNRVANNSMAF